MVERHVVVSRLMRLGLFALLSSAAVCFGASNELIDYVGRDDGAFRWKIEHQSRTATGTIYDITLTSQVWQGIRWQHQLLLYEPPRMASRDIALLFISGGSNGTRANVAESALGMMLARLCGTRCALLRQVPNQPLLGGRKEDALIAQTFLRYLDTEDPNWPLLLPMVKSAVRAMDAVQAVVRKRDEQGPKRFVVTGASKRGWTTWLTAAADDRVAAIAPMVIDTLNIPVQLPHQLEVWGRYSEQIHDYTDVGLIERLDTPRGRKLMGIVDPYSYRQRLVQPKLIINGTNDRYWALDALDFYWDQLVGPKYALYLPNAGHGLEQNRVYAVNGIAALVRHMVSGQPLPQLSWRYEDKGNSLRLVIRSKPDPISVRLWTARSDTRDFRDSHWTDSLVPRQGDCWAAAVQAPPRGRLAVLGDLEYDLDGLRYHLSTRIAQLQAATGPR